MSEWYFRDKNNGFFDETVLALIQILFHENNFHGQELPNLGFFVVSL